MRYPMQPDLNWEELKDDAICLLHEAGRDPRNAALDTERRRLFREVSQLMESADAILRFQQLDLTTVGNHD